MKKSALTFLMANKSDNKLLEVIYGFFNDNKSLDIKRISEYSYMSVSSITRFFKKNGFSGFSEFKTILLNEDNVHDNQLKIRESLENEIMLQPIKDTAILNPDEVYKTVYNCLIKSKEIIIISLGGNNSVGMELETRLERMGFKTNFKTDIHTLWIKLNNVEDNSILFAISYSGESPEIIKFAKKAKEKNMTIIALTRNTENKLSNMADIKFIVDSSENLVRINSLKSRMSMFYIVLKLAIYIYSKDPEKYNNKFLENLYV
ncbi:MurR/RpiR family transcriptional regulator [Spiroplasma endosymbiont of Labia minor]|uniref:MurR/RpiR family transcriptional regulator n=1 Tax=Spiroplasma endosymbiont of Labia minor TaxID=3066305 RepID=UPI0030D23546